MNPHIVINNYLQNASSTREKFFSAEKDNLLKGVRQTALRLINGGKILIVSDEAAKILTSYFCNLLINSPDNYPAFPVIDLTSQSVFYGNILTYSSSISRQIDVLTRSQDIIFALYFGKISENIIFSIEEAKHKEVYSIGLINKNDNYLPKFWDSIFILDCPNLFLYMDNSFAFITIFIQLLNYYIFEDPGQLSAS